MALIVQDRLVVVPVVVAEGNAFPGVVNVDGAVAAVQNGSGVEQKYLAPVFEELAVCVAETHNFPAVLFGVHGNVVIPGLHVLVVPVGNVKLLPVQLVKRRPREVGHGVTVASNCNDLHLLHAGKLIHSGQNVPLAVTAKNDGIHVGVCFYNVFQPFHTAVGVG